MPAGLQTLDLVDHEPGFVVLVLGLEAGDRDTAPLVRPQVLGRALGVVGDDRVGGVEDGLGGSIVLVENDHAGVGVVLLEVGDVADVRAPEPVDRLVGVTDHTEVAMSGGELLDQHVLGAVGVLVLVDQDVAEPLLVLGQDVGKGAEKLDRDHQQIVEVHRRRLEQALLVEAVDVGDLLVIEALALVGERLVVDQLVLGLGDDGFHRLGREALGVELEVLEHQVDQAHRVGLVVDGESRPVPEPRMPRGEGCAHTPSGRWRPTSTGRRPRPGHRPGPSSRWPPCW